MPTSHSSARKLDQFYTQNHTVQQCLTTLRETMTSLKYSWDQSFFIEPSAGEGAFLSQLPKSRRIGIDIDAKHPEIITADFLTWEPCQSIFQHENIVCVGNPPFGVNSQLALQFINRCALFSKLVAMIVHPSLDELSNKIHPQLHLTTSLALPDAQFMFNNKLVPVPCSFKVWERKDTFRSH